MNFDRLRAAAIAVDPASIEGHWQIIQFLPNLATGERFNIGVIFTQPRKSGFHARLLSNLNGFSALYGAEGVDNFAFLLAVLREQLFTELKLVSPSPQIIFGSKKYAAGNNPHQIVDRLFETMVTLRSANDDVPLLPALRGTVQTKKLRDRITRIATQTMGKDWPSIFRNYPVSIEDNSGKSHFLDLPIWRGQDLVSAQIYGTILSACFRSPVHRAASLYPGYMNFDQASQFAKHAKGGLLILRPNQKNSDFDSQQLADIDNDIEKITWPYRKQKNITICIAETPEELTTAALSLA